MSVLPSTFNRTTDNSIRRRGSRRASNVFPSGPVIGDLFYETDTKILWIWTGTAWRTVFGEGVIAGTNNFYDGIELYQPSSTPYIDFHRAANPAGDGNADFNIRLINDGTNYLTLSCSAGSDTGVFRGMAVIDFPDTVRDNKIDLYGGSYLIGVRGGTMYFKSGGTNFDFETPPGSWAMRYGNYVNGAERGLKIEGNMQSNEHYSNGWYRSLSAATGWYSQAHGRGIFMDNSTYVKVYGGAEFWNPSGKIRAEMARFGQSGPWADHVAYSHNNYQQDGNCGFMQRWDGWAWWRSSGQLGFTSRGSDIAWMDSSGGWCDFRPNLVGLGGDPCVIAGSNQLGRGSSSIRWKDRIGNLLGTEESPIWRFQPVRFLWKEDDGIHPTRNEVNARNPIGIAGFIAEEMAEIAPDAVNYDNEGIPSSLESWALLAYVVAGMQYLKERIDALEEGI